MHTTSETAARSDVPPSSPWTTPAGERLGLGRHYTDLELAYMLRHPGARYVFAVPPRVM